MSIQAILWANQVDCPNAPSQQLLVFLAFRCREGAECYPSLDDIRSRTKLAKGTIRKALKTLVDAGLLVIEERFHASQRQTSNLYRLAVASIRTESNFADSFEGGDVKSGLPPEPEKTADSRGRGSNPIPREGVKSGIQNLPERIKEERTSLRSAEIIPIDIRSTVFTEGLAIVRSLTGRSENSSRAILGKCCKTAGDDCARVMAALRSAADLRPADPVAFVLGALGSSDFRGGKSVVERLHEMNGTSMYRVYFDEDGEEITDSERVAQLRDCFDMNGNRVLPPDRGYDIDGEVVRELPLLRGISS